MNSTIQVLIAEDEITTRRMLERMFERLGYACICVEDGEQAWEVLSSDSAPQIAVVDWIMPGMSGIEVCQKVRAKDSSKYTYLIMLTGKDSDEDVVSGLAAGADDYLKKPFKAEELKARLRTAERIIRQDQTLRHLLSRHSRVLEAIPSALVVTNNDDEIIEWNSQAEEFFDISTETAVGTKLTRLGVNWDWTLILQNLALCWDREETVLVPSIRLTGRESESRLLDVTITPLSREKVSLPSVLIVLNDVTRQRELQEKLYLAQKLESVGKLSAGVAHEINTPSQFVRNNLFFLKDSFEKILGTLVDREEHKELIEEIPESIAEAIDGIDRVTNIVRAIGKYVHPDDGKKAVVHVNELVDGCLTMTRHVWKSKALIERQFDEELPALKCHQSSIQQVIVNLIVNAVDAIEEKQSASNEKKITIRTNSDDKNIHIIVTDTGIGIAPETLKRIFDPFFTTKEVGKGTGQGLAIIRRIIADQHRGSIDVISEPGKGSSFTISIPWSESTTESASTGSVEK